MTDNFLLKAVFISLAAHMAIIGVFYFKRIHDPYYNALHQNRVEISYSPRYHRAVDIKEHPIRPSQRLDLSNDQKYFSDGDVPVSLVKDKPALPFSMLYEHKPQRMQVMELSHRISIMPITSAKINNPAYAAYNEMVHDRIKEKAGENYDKMEMGSVYLAFLIDNKGELVEIHVVQAKTNASEHLQEGALKSVRDASPFPSFYKGMNLWEYPLEIEIQYQVSND